MLNVITGSSHYNLLSFVTSYRGISDYHSNKMVITTSAMKELHRYLNFQQLRFHCRKHSVGRTFHVVTAANSSGKTVVQYFSGLTDVLPESCGSYVRMRMMTPNWQDIAVNGMANLVSGRPVWETGIILWKEYITTLHGFLTSIIGTLCKETLLSAMINMHHRPLVIFGRSSFVKENDNALNACLFCHLSL